MEDNKNCYWNRLDGCYCPDNNNYDVHDCESCKNFENRKEIIKTKFSVLISVKVKCPYCQEFVDVGDQFTTDELGWKMIDQFVDCPNCAKNFIIDEISGE